MEILDNDIEELERKLAELKEKKRLELEAAKKIPVISFMTYNKDTRMFSVKIDLEDENERWKYNDILRHIWSRKVELDKINPLQYFHIRDYYQVIDLLVNSQEKFELKLNDELRERLIKIIEGPGIVFELSPKKDKVWIQTNPIVQHFYLDGLDSLVRNTSTDSYTLNANELWRALQIVKEKYPNLSIKLDDESSKLAESQVSRRDAMAQIAKAEDWDIDIKIEHNPWAIENDKHFKGFQKVAVRFAEITDNNCLLALDMGLGKTPIAIEIVERNNFRVLFVVPATLKTNTWREINKWTGKDAVILSGIEPDSLAIKALFENKSQYTIINYDVIGRETKENKRDKNEVGIMKWVEFLNLSKFDIIVSDEIHYIKNMNSLRSKGTRGLIAKHYIGLSGTPIVNRPGELYPALNFIDRAKFAREIEFLNAFMDQDGSPKNVKRLHELLQDYMFRRKKEDVIKNLPPITRIDHFTTLSDEAYAHYQTALAGLYVSLKNPNFQREIHSILAELMRLKQIISDDKVPTTVYLAQTALEETGEKVLIFSQFVQCCRDISMKLGRRALCITGETPDDERYKAIDRFQNESDNDYMVLSTKAGAEGITLTKAHTVIFNDLCWTPKDHRQAEARCYGRLSDMHGAIAYYVQAEKTVDEMIGALLQKKLVIIEEVVDNVHTDQGVGESIVMELLTQLKAGMK